MPGFQLTYRGFNAVLGADYLAKRGRFFYQSAALNTSNPGGKLIDGDPSTIQTRRRHPKFFKLDRPECLLGDERHN